MKVKKQKIEQVAISDLMPDPNNVRTHDEKNINAIKASLESFGQQKPIVVNAEGTVIAGNGTMQAAADLGWTHIDVVRSDLEGEAARAFGIADNRTAELAIWDDAELATALEALRSSDVDLFAASGFSDKDLDQILRDQKNGDAEEDIDESALMELQYRVVVEVESEDHQASVIERLEREGFVCRPLIS